MTALSFFGNLNCKLLCRIRKINIKIQEEKEGENDEEGIYEAGDGKRRVCVK